jgi:molybdate transport system substrate-binding protein
MIRFPTIAGGVAREIARSLAALALLAAASCSGTSSPSGEKTTVNVYAAASLEASFREIGAAFAKANPNDTAAFQFAGSPTLVTQIQNGAAADVFASADEPNMAKLDGAQLLAGAPEIFAHNRLAIAVVPGNPKHIAGLADLARADVVLALCAPEVPAGRYGKEILARAGVKVAPKTLEESVRGVVGKVGLDEVDAGIVYVSDVRASAGKVAGVAIPGEQNVIANYPIAVVKGSKAPGAARRFVAFVRSPEGARILAAYGFEIP